MGKILLIDFGSTYTKLTAVDLRQARVLGTAKAFTTSDTDIMVGYEDALAQLSCYSELPKDCEKLASSSAAGGLRMVTIGLVPELTAKAARLAALSAGAKVLKVYSYELTTSQLQEIADLQPEIILLTGGTDGGNQKVILANAQALSRLPCDPPIIYAGNRSAAAEAAALLRQTKTEVTICDNVMPIYGQLAIEPVRQLIRDIFLKRIIQAKGLSQAAALVSEIIMPTPAAVLAAMELLADGLPNQPGLKTLLCVDVGGATTDVYSIMEGKPSEPNVIYHGLQEPYAKRTVEGDLGVRYSVQALLEACSLAKISELAGLSQEDTAELIQRLQVQPYLLKINDARLSQLDDGLAKAAVQLAVTRHAGTVHIEYTAAGALKLQEGKDLSEAQYIIGTGGAIINSQRPANILQGALKQPGEPELYLKPKQAKLLLDQDYIVAAMGLLAQRYPEIALKIMKDRLLAIE